MQVMYPATLFREATAMSIADANARHPSGQPLPNAAHQANLLPMAPAVRIRGGVARGPTQAPLAACRSLSIVLIRTAPAAPTTALNGLIEVPPIGLAYLAASLKRAGHRVRIVDAFGEQPSQLVEHPDGFVTQGLTPEQIVG